MNFNCDKCGLCCRSLKKFGELYADLDDGSGVCKFLDKTSNLCIIYDMRPLKCRVEDAYKAYFSKIPYKVYIDFTYQMCENLKKQHESN